MSTIALFGALLSSDPSSPLGEQPKQALAWGGADAALGNEGGDEVGRGHVEGVFGGGAVRRHQVDGDAPAIIGPAFDVSDLARVAALDWIAVPLSISQSIVGEGSAT
jgi:hypothetical protein